MNGYKLDSKTLDNVLTRLRRLGFSTRFEVLKVQATVYFLLRSRIALEKLFK